MGSHPINLALRFLLEIAALGAIAYWGWTQHDGVARYVLAFGLPLLAMIVWSIFRVNGDPGDAPVAIPGLLRLALELVLFVIAVWMLHAAGQPNWGLILAVVVGVHYITSYDRLQWLIQQ